MSGTPVIAPVLVLSVRPLGNVPLVTDHVLVPEPPVVAKVVLYAAPMVPVGSGEVVVMVSVSQLIVQVYGWSAVLPSESVARIVKL